MQITQPDQAGLPIDDAVLHTSGLWRSSFSVMPVTLLFVLLCCYGLLLRCAEGLSDRGIRGCLLALALPGETVSVSDREVLLEWCMVLPLTLSRSFMLTLTGVTRSIINAFLQFLIDFVCYYDFLWFSVLFDGFSMLFNGFLRCSMLFNTFQRFSMFLNICQCFSMLFYVLECFFNASKYFFNTVSLLLSIVFICFFDAVRCFSMLFVYCSVLLLFVQCFSMLFSAFQFCFQ